MVWKLFLVYLFLSTSITVKCSSAITNNHIELSSPQHRSVVAPGTKIFVAYKVSNWYLSQSLKGACLVVRILAPEREEPQVLTCKEGIDSFTVIPNAPGMYAVSVEAWSSDGLTVLKHMSKANEVIVRDDESFDLENYHRREGFRMIYEYGHWGEDGGRSGDGSSLEGSNSDSDFLLKLFTSLKVRSVFDAGCGALVWQPALLDAVHQKTGRHVRYHGADIVEDVVSANQHRFADNATMSFSELDIAQNKIPTGFDVILCRHALFHNTNAAVHKILEEVSNSGAQWFVATTLRFIDESIPSLDSNVVNVELEMGTDGRLLKLGGYRPVELEAPPFNLPPPLQWELERDFNGKLVQEYGRQRYLAVWSLPFRK